MKLQDALSRIHAPKGQTSVITGLLTGDFAPIRDQSAIGVHLSEARQKLEQAREAQRNCTSDWAWWGYNGDIAYWTCVVDLLSAAEIVGADNLPDIPLPELSGVVMDVQAKIEDWGAKVLHAAQQQQEDAE